MSRPCIAPGTEEQSRAVPAIPLEPYLDRAQRARECAAMSLGDLLLASGAVEGPFKRPRLARKPYDPALLVALLVTSVAIVRALALHVWRST